MSEIRPQPAFARPYSFDGDGPRQECKSQEGISDWLYLVAHAPKTPLWDFEPHGLPGKPVFEQAPDPALLPAEEYALYRQEQRSLQEWEERRENLRLCQWPGVWADAMLAEQERRRAR